MVPIIAFARASSSISSSLRKLAVPNFDHSLIPNLELLQILKITGNGNKYIMWSIYQNVRNAIVTHRFVVMRNVKSKTKYPVDQIYVIATSGLLNLQKLYSYK
jgi:hypothetical protein